MKKLSIDKGVTSFICLVAYIIFSLPATAQDPRLFNNGLQIPDENYADQPYIVKTKDGGWLCTLTTGPGKESTSGQHIISTISYDEGKTWSDPVDIEPSGELESSWIIPFVTPSGRIYAFYNYNGDNIRETPDGKPIKISTILGWYVFKFSDDNGRTWSKERYRLPLKPAAVDLENDWNGKVQLFWGIDKPITIGNDMIFAFTRLKKYLHDLGEGWFFRSNNILTEKDPNKINWQLLPETPQGIRNDDMDSVQEEHNVVALSNGDLFCVYRTTKGYPAGSYSRDDGRTWSKPEPLTYPDGRIIRTPRACAAIWQTENGKYLLWIHNTSVQFTHYKADPVNYPTNGRDLGWLVGGIEKEGRIVWSQPELVAYVMDRGISYPDLVEDKGQFWISMTNKRDARLIKVDRTLIEGLWTQAENKKIAQNGILFTLANSKRTGTSGKMPRLPNPIYGGSFAFDFWIKLNNNEEGQILFDSRNKNENGILIRTEKGGIQLSMNDGMTKFSWASDTGSIATDRWHHVTINVDGGPKLITFVIDGKLCSGIFDETCLTGFGRFLPATDFQRKVTGKDLDDVSGSDTFFLAPNLKGEIRQFRIFNRYLRTSESIGHFNAGIATR